MQTSLPIQTCLVSRCIVNYSTDRDVPKDNAGEALRARPGARPNPPCAGSLSRSSRVSRGRCVRETWSSGERCDGHGI